MKRAYFNYPYLWPRFPVTERLIVPLRMQSLFSYISQTIQRDLAR